MKATLCFLFFTFYFLLSTAQAQQRINVLTDSVIISGPYADTEAKIFTNRRTEYTPEIARYGLHFRNGRYNLLTQPISGEGQNSSAIIGAYGAGTVVELNGRFTNDNGGAKPSLYVGNGGRIRFGALANVNLVLQGSYFTRQFWIMGDGTGTIELDRDFVADRTVGGTVASGLGSIRISACTLQTHSTQSLPMGYRPYPNSTNPVTGAGKINSHLVFENAPGSVWHVIGNQEYRGGLWVRKDMEVRCDRNTYLNLNGDTTVWPDYINYGGIYLQDSSITITKTGVGQLFLSGRHGYAPGSLLYVDEGDAIIRTNPGNRADSIFNSVQSRFRHGPNLNAYCAPGASLYFESPAGTQRNYELTSLISQGTVTVHAGNKVKAKTVIFIVGQLSVYFETPPQVGDTITLFEGSQLSIQPSQVVPINLGFNLALNLMRLDTFGQIIIDRSVAIKAVQKAILFYPNPAKTHITLPTLPQNTKPTLVNAQGKTYSLTRVFNNKFTLPILTKGLYTIMAEGFAPTRLVLE